MPTKIFSSVQAQYIGARKTKSNDDAAGFFTMNATLFGANIIKGLEISASVYNLFDKLYEDPVSTAYKQDVIEQNGRTFRLKLTYSF
jgi:outer membrane receptor for ferrienterochelin and colicins